MAKLRSVSKAAEVVHSVPTVGERVNEKNSRGDYRIMAAGTWTTRALCGAETERGEERKIGDKSRACKTCLHIIARLYD